MLIYGDKVDFDDRALGLFLSRITAVPNECWQWNGTITYKGYGAFERRGKALVAHRVTYELFVGPIPDGCVLDHLCRTRSCVNPAHLEAVTNRENILRGESPSAKRARQEVCHNGHPFIRSRNGTRKCRICKNASERASRRNRRVANVSSKNSAANVEVLDRALARPQTPAGCERGRYPPGPSRTASARTHSP